MSYFPGSVRTHGAFILTRFSTDKQNETSTKDQIDICTQWCNKAGIPILGVFSDEAISGMKDTRPRYQAMMEQLRWGAADTVVIYDQSRMFRKMTAWFDFRDKLERMGVNVISTTQPLVGKDLRDPQNFMFEGSTALFNQMWSLQTRQRVMVTMRRMAKEGLHTGGQPPLGYCTKDGALSVCESEAAVVRRIFKEYADGSSYREIIDGLNRDGITTRRGNPFGTNSLHDLLKNEKYIGVLVYGKAPRRADGSRNTHGQPPEDMIRLENAVPAIIDTSTWEVVQKKMAKNKRAAAGRPANTRSYPLKGKVFCGECGAALTGTISQYKYHYYSCSGKQRLKNCDLKPIKMDDLEQCVASAVQQILGNASNIEKLVQVLRSESDSLQNQGAEKLKRLSSRQDDIDRQLDQATTAILNGLQSQSLINKIHALENERSRIILDIEQLQRTIDSVSIPAAMLRELFQVVISTNDVATLLHLVTRVEVYHDSIKVWTILDGDHTDPPRHQSFFDESALIPVDGITFSSGPSNVINIPGSGLPAPPIFINAGMLQIAFPRKKPFP